MSERERNFANFELGDDVHKLADGLILELAERLDIPLSNEPNIEELSKLVGAVGENKVLRNNRELYAIDLETQVDLVERSGVQEKLNRSLWSPDKDISEAKFIVQTGAVANWMDRGEQIVMENSSFGTKIAYTLPGVIFATGNRVMDSSTEQTNEHVEQFYKLNGRHPTEYEYGRSIASRLKNDNMRMCGPIFSQVLEVDTQNGEQVAESLFSTYPKLLDSKIAFARAANAGIHLAIQMRQAAQKQRADYDSDPSDPQVFVLTDSFPIARNYEQVDKPREYQNAQTALRQVAITAKLLHEAAGGE